MEDYITPIKDNLDFEMHQHCAMFMLIGTPRESPRWLNFGHFDLESKILLIQSTQTDRILFEVETDFVFIPCDEFWPQFKKYRTEFLEKYYPTIKTN